MDHDFYQARDFLTVHEIEVFDSWRSQKWWLQGLDHDFYAMVREFEAIDRWRPDLDHDFLAAVLSCVWTDMKRPD